MRPPQIGDSPTAKAFGAQIQAALPERGLYLVIGHDASVTGLVQGTGGQVIVTFPNTFKLLAILPISTFFTLRQHRLIVMVGPVSIDPQRFARFAAIAGLDTNGSDNDRE
jgi:hypothetical protein